MSRRMPSLNALRAFEAAGRHSSFTLAADELCVTPGAVSRQIKSLELMLGQQLFERHHREVVLTEKAGAYLDCLTRSFELIRAGTDRFLQSHDEQRLNIYCSMTVTMRWLVPRLGDFHAAHPKREICMHTPIPAPLPAHLHQAFSSVAVRLGVEHWPDCENIRLLTTRLVPVCSPELAERLAERPPERMFDDATLLHSLARPDDWAHWAAAVNTGVDIARETNRHVRFESSSLAYQAAMSGVGVAMGQLALVMDDLCAGRLAMPALQIVEDGSAIFLSVRPEFSGEPGFLEFREWLTRQANAYETQEAQFLASHDMPAYLLAA